MANAETKARMSAAQRGNRNRSILSDDQIRAIKTRFLAAPDTNATKLAEQLGVPPAVVVRVRTGKTGGHVYVAGFTPIVSVTRSAAAKHRRSQNTAKLGATLEERLAKADEIRARRDAGESAAVLAAANGISRRHVYDILNGKSLVRDRRVLQTGPVTPTQTRGCV